MANVSSTLSREASILLTPFRTQNVPPPMSSYQLSLPDHRTPIHISFSRDRDVLAVLWDSGSIELWALHTRIGPGQGKVMDPQKVFSGAVKDAEFRQVVSWSGGEKEEIKLAILGSERCGMDVIVFMKFGDDGKVETDRKTMKMSGRNGRLVEYDHGVVWQARDGTLFNGMDFDFLVSLNFNLLRKLLPVIPLHLNQSNDFRNSVSHRRVSHRRASPNLLAYPIPISCMSAWRQIPILRLWL
jgi:IKI3 family